jgi:hypothetical protein
VGALRSVSGGAAVLVLGVFASLPLPSTQAAGSPVSLDVDFRLTDLDYQPIRGANVRLVFGDEPWRQPASAGAAFTTGPDGDARLTVQTTIDKRLKKLPTNFVDSLTSLPKETDHLTVGAELGYAAFRWLYIVDMFRFPQGGDVSDGLSSLYSRDGQGRFSRKASYDGRAWKIADLNGMPLTTAGHDVYDFRLQPKAGATNAWTLKLAFKRHPEPVRR